MTGKNCAETSSKSSLNHWFYIFVYTDLVGYLRRRCLFGILDSTFRARTIVITVHFTHPGKKTENINLPLGFCFDIGDVINFSYGQWHDAVEPSSTR